MTSPTAQPPAPSPARPSTQHPLGLGDEHGTRKPDGASGDSERSVVEITTALAELRVTSDAVGGKSWLSSDIAGEPAVSIDLLGSTSSPLSALSSAGCDFLTPMISFLEEPLGELKGEPGAVSGSAGEHDGAAQGANAVADDYRSTVEDETSEWSGPAKTDYVQTAEKLVDGVKSIAEAAATNAKAMIAAGEVVAQVADIVTRLITEAVGKIVPIMTEAIAAAPATFGMSIAQAIPQCVAIAVDYAGQIAAKLAALLASGENLVTLLEGAVGLLDVVKEGLNVVGDLAGGSASSASGLATAPDSDSASETSGTTSGSSQSSADSADSADSGNSGDSDNSGENADSTEQGERQGVPANPLDGEWTPVRTEGSS
ncbi:hypothetical protein SAXI111661_21855 [Saccharomonospora xinjiangensis]|uniref:WXG100 family type VII secretion target n=1 Tax=Saccharomonospora xinjiangensis TaxID=75294 RepID=UPI0010C4E830|nr:hypothetical protein [Saccharomonospora xinjiangensis]QBQ60649.1 hypothetical protein EYD13_11480 [Saccharomonospora xinjiangensis]